MEPMSPKNNPTHRGGEWLHRPSVQARSGLHACRSAGGSTTELAEVQIRDTVPARCVWWSPSSPGPQYSHEPNEGQLLRAIFTKKTNFVSKQSKAIHDP